MENLSLFTPFHERPKDKFSRISELLCLIQKHEDQGMSRCHKTIKKVVFMTFALYSEISETM